MIFKANKPFHSLVKPIFSYDRLASYDYLSLFLLLFALLSLYLSRRSGGNHIKRGASSLNFSLFCCILCGAGCHCFWPGRINTCLCCCCWLLRISTLNFPSPEFIVFVYKVFACTIVRCSKLMASEGGSLLGLPLLPRGLSENNVMEIMRKRKVNVSFKRGLLCATMTTIAFYLH